MRPDNKGDEYEFYVMTATLVGTAHRAGTQRVIADGQHFTNLRAAGFHFLQLAGESKLAATVNSYIHSASKKVLLPAAALVERGVWNKFCEIRDLKTTSDTLAKTYVLSKQELETLGLTDAG